MISLKDLGFYYPGNLDVSGSPLAKQTNWGPGSDGDYTIAKKMNNVKEVVSISSFFSDVSEISPPAFVETTPPIYTSWTANAVNAVNAFHRHRY